MYGLYNKEDVYMYVYKELNFVGNKEALDELSREIYNVFPLNWVKSEDNELSKKYILADYIGNAVPKAEVAIYYDDNIWREGYIKVNNIIPLQKNELSIEEYNKILDLFYKDIVEPYCKKHTNIKIEGPTSDKFDPLNYISQEALDKLILFCDSANKSTGSSHPCDQERWFDFICQTVDDGMMFDYDTLFEFLIDESYWGKKESGFLGVMGHFAWDEEMAERLASEYDRYVEIVKYYKNTRRDK